GIGMTAEGLRGAFEPFVRSADVVERGIPGIGLGLYICRGIMARHGGGIDAESEPGSGVSVTFWMPREG
ncbi:MAG: sensor histidine kinase, partial [Thermomicrobiales bacterium]